MVGGAGEGLRSVGEEALPSSKSVCSILPLARHLRAGVLRGSGPYNALGRASVTSQVRPFALASLCPTPIGPGQGRPLGIEAGLCRLFLLKVLQSKTQTHEGGVSL